MDEFKLTGISISMDVAIAIAVIGLVYTWLKDRRERRQREIDSANRLLLDELQHWDQLIDRMFETLKSGSFQELSIIHSEIWSKLRKLRMLAAVQADPKAYDVLAKHIEMYATYMQSKDVKSGFVELGKMMRSMMSLLQKDENLLDNYFMSRFGETMRNEAA